jgi:hypothetical protein
MIPATVDSEPNIVPSRSTFDCRLQSLVESSDGSMSIRRSGRYTEVQRDAAAASSAVSAMVTMVTMTVAEGW